MLEEGFLQSNRSPSDAIAGDSDVVTMLTSLYDGITRGSERTKRQCLLFIQQGPSSPIFESMNLHIRWNYQARITTFISNARRFLLWEFFFHNFLVFQTLKRK